MKKETLKGILNPLFLVYGLLMILFGILFFKINSNIFRIISLILFIILQLVYNIKIGKKEDKIFNWAYFLIFFVYLIIYSFLQFGQTKIAVIGFIALPFIGIIGTVLVSWNNLINSKRVRGIIVHYILMAILIILLFSMIFILTGINEKNKIQDSDLRTIKGAGEYIWFSAGNFYTCNFGEHPYGLSKYISYLEMMISFIFHVIILNWILNNKKLLQKP